MATTTIRWALIGQLVDLFRQHDSIGGCQVYRLPPGNLDEHAEMIFPIKAGSTVRVPTMKPGRLARDDNQSIEWVVIITGAEDEDALMSRLDELEAVIDDVFADDSALGSLDGVISAQVTATDLAEVSPSPAGFGAQLTVTTEIHTRLN